METKEIKDTVNRPQNGLNDLLSHPDKIVSLPELKDKPELTSPKLWEGLYDVNNVVKSLIDKSVKLDANNPNEVFTVEIGADNGVFMAYKNQKDPTQTTTIYLSSHGIKISDWGPGLTIQPDRVLCHQVKIVSRKQVAPNIYTASEIQYRVSKDFKYIEGDPNHRTELLEQGMYTDGQTFLFDTLTRQFMSYIEVYDPTTDNKNLAPLVADAKDLWKLTSDSTRGEIFWRLFTGKLEEKDINRMAPAFVDLGDKVAIDTTEILEIGKQIAKDLIAQTSATMRITPTSVEYLADLKKNLSESSPIAIDNKVSFAKSFDVGGIAKRKYLEKRASKKLIHLK